MHSGNIGPRSGMPDGGVGGPMKLYDSLPQSIRAALQSSSFNYAIGTIHQAVATRDEQAALAWIVEGDKINVRNAARSIYGPDHPQAQEDYQYEPITSRPRTAKRIPIR